MKITFLGCGGSGGVPMIGGENGQGDWGNCDPLEPKNRRTRSSIVIETLDQNRILVDSGPDLRTQLLRASIGHLDAVIYTHAHADHIAGLDDLRAINRAIGKPLPIFATQETLEELKKRFSYAFRPWTTAPHFFRPVVEATSLEYGDVIEVAGIKVQTFEQSHGFSRSLGLRFGQFAYCTDVVDIDDDGLNILSSVKIWIIGCFQRAPHPTHMWLERIFEWRDKIRPQRTILTHMGVDMDWEWLQNNLPTGVEVAYDGLFVYSD